MERKIKKIVECTCPGKCPFGLEKIDAPCAICRYREDKIVRTNIPPILIEVTNTESYSCYKKQGIALYDICPFGRKEANQECIGCGRLTVKVIESKTKEIK